MARKPRLQFAGAIYHVMVRRNGGNSLFKDNADRMRWMAGLEQQVGEYGIRLYLYCLMDTHAHMVFETPRANLSAFMGSLLTGYAMYFNRRHGLRGHVFESRYKSILVEGDIYLLRLSRYLHTNPVRTRASRRQSLKVRLAKLSKYPWSSYRRYAGYVPARKPVEYAPILSITPGRGAAADRYRRFVETELINDDMEFLEDCRGAGLALGSAAFRRNIERRYSREIGDRVAQEDIALRRQVDRVESEQILAAVCSHYGIKRAALMQRRRADEIRPVAAALLTRFGCLTQREAGRLLGLTTGSAVCRQLTRLRSAPSPAQTRALARLTKTLYH